MVLTEILKDALKKQASDIFIVSGTSIGYRISGKIVRLSDDEILLPDDTNILIRQIFEMAGYSKDQIQPDSKNEYDFSFSMAGLGRFRANIYRQRGSLAAVLRTVMYDLPDYKSLHIPEKIMNLADTKKGIVLITGSAGSGKSTTLTCMLDKINATRQGHIITIEDPIEFLHRHKKCIISQREINIDARDYVKALRAALRQSPDVILVGEMRDYETMNIAMTAAETGQFILSTLHTIGAANTIDRVIDVFPSSQQHQIRIQLAMVLQAVISQQLIPTVDGGLIPAFEIMNVNNAVRTMIREQKTHQIDTIIQSSEGMQTMDTDILRLYKEGIISKESAINYASNSEMMRKRIG
ncbi:MAG: PilT/PilU family type 4a pilus ATPase [Lachnospiraceae bacterium]|nr:PilT/PilU family type 4a pilus ATPase [Lachnospiraceae bacterium]